MNEFTTMDPGPVREADAPRIAQQFIAGMWRENDKRSPRSGRLGVMAMLRSAILNRPFHGLDWGKQTPVPSDGSLGYFH
jgi:hypothetical protein